MALGYGSVTHFVIFGSFVNAITACNTKMPQSGTRKWADVSCKRCLAKQPKIKAGN